MTSRILRWVRGRLGSEEQDAVVDVGMWGEEQAERFLRKHGYKILGRRVRVGQRDELDLVVRNKDTLVFVEVKTRGGEDYGRPISAVNRNKQKALSRAAVRYLKRIKFPQTYFRFDVVEVVGSPGDEEPVLRHTENAFQLDRRYSLPY